jgi:D-arabinose 1-dehydrogenase-like Zn-dependent alcohol dehydrogenase
MRHWGVTHGKKVGVVGLGGLGHMGVKFARAFGAHVVVFTTSPSKEENAIRLGADEVVVSSNADEMKKHIGSFDFILDTCPDRDCLAAGPETVDCSDPRHHEAASFGGEHRRSLRRAHARRSR